MRAPSMLRARGPALAVLAVLLIGLAPPSLGFGPGIENQRMPEEGEPHDALWMAFKASPAIWGDLKTGVEGDLARIAHNIAYYEPVMMIYEQSDMARGQELGLFDNPNITMIEAPCNDLWMRDTGPVFVTKEDGTAAGVKFNFNGWGDKQDFAQDFSKDAVVADFVTSHVGVPMQTSSLVLEGGGIEVDGHGLAIITESCVLNDNRNPGKSKEEVEEELKDLLGLHTIIWLPGIKGKDITDAHTDFYARFSSPGVVIAHYETDTTSYDNNVTEIHLRILEEFLNNGTITDLVVLDGPATARRPMDAWFAAGYVNFLVGNGFVLGPEFGDPAADEAARSKLTPLFPGRDIVLINIDNIAAGGGGIHCTTQQQPTPVAWVPKEDGDDDGDDGDGDGYGSGNDGDGDGYGSGNDGDGDGYGSGTSPPPLIIVEEEEEEEEEGSGFGGGTPTVTEPPVAMATDPPTAAPTAAPTPAPTGTVTSDAAAAGGWAGLLAAGVAAAAVILG